MSVIFRTAAGSVGLLSLAAAIILAFAASEGSFDAMALEHAHNLELTVDGSALSLPVPEGSCVVDQGEPLDVQSAAVLAALSGNSSRMLAWFVDCNTLEQFRAGAIPGEQVFHRYGLYVTPVNEEGVPEDFSGMPRDTFVRKIADSMPRFDRASLDPTVGKIREEAVDTVSLTRMVVGLIGRDDAAYYLACTAELTVGTYRQRFVAVSGATLVDGHAISIILYRDLENAETLTVLERDVRAATLALIDANPGGDTFRLWPWLDANCIMLIAFGIGMLFIAIGIVNSAWKWWCRRHGVQP